MRRLMLSLGAAGLFAVIGAAPGGAAQTRAVGAGACNQGTMRAHATVPHGNPAHARIPHAPAAGECEHTVGRR